VAKEHLAEAKVANVHAHADLAADEGALLGYGEFGLAEPHFHDH